MRVVEADALIVACIPAYNEENTIAKVVLGAKEYADVVVVCDDGSEDLTGGIARGLGATVIRHDKNLGYGMAIQSLFKKARELDADVMLTLDGDGQHDAREIPNLVEPILEDKADIVVGSRFLNKENNDVPAYRRFGIKLITRLSEGASKNGLSDGQSGLRAYNKKAIQSLALSENGMGVSAEILLRAKEQNLRMTEVPVHTQYHGLETSTHNWFRHGASVITSIFRLIVEERPLLYVGIPGIVFLSAGILFGVWMLHIFADEGYIPMGPALASVAFVLVGLFIVFTAITLYAIVRVTQKQKRW